ncbi:type VI secretion system-associated protein TagO [Roseovarius indicus]|uniref:type VI secretion system-associated protein TagO n=1 Tax=Roseovarius indicus TaxID=540747 RepID=UPI001C2FAFA1|nr:type VI secretion system-associated protein TagO [Roseovarius indicus]
MAAIIPEECSAWWLSEGALLRQLVQTAAVFVATSVGAQSATDRPAWQNAGSFAPLSRTAAAITGEITLSKNAEGAADGRTLTLTFGNGAAVDLTSIGASWRTQGMGGDIHAVEMFKLAGHPGAFENGNTLCGGEAEGENLYAVFFEQSLFNLPPSLGLAIFQSVEPPFDINSSGLCGTFSYTIAAPPGQDKERSNEPAVSSKAQASSGSAAAGPGAWRVRTSINPIDDTRTVSLFLDAETGTSRYGDPITFVARCKSNRTEAYVVWGEYLGDDSRDVYAKWKHVTVRIGDEQARQERWGVSTDSKATFAPDWAGTMLKQLLDKNRLVLQTIPYGENPQTAIFDISGLRSVLGQLAGECDWSF